MAVLTGLAEFLAVVESGGFTAAAEVLGASKSHVSRRVTGLEQQLTTRLLTRTTRRVALTEMGRLYYDRSRALVDGLDALEADLADLQARPKGRIRLTAPGIYAERYVAPALAEFLVRYPEVDIDFDTQMTTVDLVAEGYDLAIRMSALADSDLVARRVENRRVIVCGSPDYLSRKGRPERPEDLLAHQCLRLRGMAWRFAWPEQVREVRVRGSWSTDNGNALVTAALEGLGLIRLADYYVGPDLQLGTLEPVLEAYEVDDAATWIVYPDRVHLPTRVRLLIDHLIEALRGRFSPARDYGADDWL